MAGICSSIIRYNATENVCVCVWIFGRIGSVWGVSSEPCVWGEMHVAKPTGVFWNFTKEFYFLERLNEIRTYKYGQISMVLPILYV